MKSKSPKVYTVPQVGKVLGVGITTVYDYIKAGLVHAEHRATAPGKRGRLTVSEAEFERLKRSGVDARGVTAKLAGSGVGGRAAAKKKTTVRGAAGAVAAAAAKKPAKRKNAAATAKKPAKRAASARGSVAKKTKKR